MSAPIPFIDAAGVRAATPWPELIEAIRSGFLHGSSVPPRHHHEIEVPGAAAGTCLLMPAWTPGATLGVKVVNVFPDNARHGLPAVAGLYILCSAVTGEPLALIDGSELTARRTAAASALAAGFLARSDASRMVMVGTGRLARELVPAHAYVRRITEVLVWGRSADKAAALVGELTAAGYPTRAADDLEAAVRGADLVSCATTSATPLVAGAWLRPGAHLDLVGGFTPAMRETDDDAVRRASVWVDTIDGATGEAGDIVQPLASGVLPRAHIRGDLFGLCRGEVGGRTDADEITLFKSVGTALEDLAAATLVHRSVGQAVD